MKKFQKALVVTKDSVVKIVNNYEIAPLHDYECRVRVVTCAFCNATDHDIIEHLLHGVTMEDYPLVLGHEGGCEVVEVGPKVRYIREGDRFMSPYNYADKTYNVNFGNFAEYAVVCDYQAMEEDGNLGLLETDYPFYASISRRAKPVDKRIDFNTIAVMRPMCECYSAIQNFGVRPDMDVLIFGAGPMGIGVSTFLAMQGVKSHVIVDLSQKRLDLAKEIAPNAETICLADHKLSDVLKDRQFDIVIDIVGLSSVLIEGSQYLRPNGIIGSMGVLKGEDAKFNVLELQNHTRLHMLNFPSNEYGAFDYIVEKLLSGELDPKRWYSHVMPLEQIEEGVRMIKSKEAFKIVFTI